MSSTRRLAAIMFTDMVGYTALTQADEPLALSVLERHQRILRPIFPKFGGKEVKTMGDSFLVEFESALEATNCAVEIQRTLHDYNTSSTEGWKIRLRIGIHLGDVIHSQEDVLGDSVNVASRIEPLAEPEGVCISAEVFAQVRNKLVHPITALGSKQLKNVQLPSEVYKVVLPWEGTTGVQSDVNRRRIAVMPFRNISRDPGDEYFADGMTEELISSLSKIRELRVISRTSVMRYKGTNKGLGEIGKELNVGSVLEGSVRRASEDLRITAQLIDPKSDEYLWSNDYDRKLENVFAIQTEIARSVADALKVQLLASEQEDIERKATENTEAYALFLQGRSVWNQRVRGANDKAVSYFERAMKLDPNFSLAQAGLADCYVIAGDYGWRSPSETYPKAKHYALKAIETDPRLAEPHATLGLVYANYEWKWREAEQEFRTAIELKPSYATAHQWFGVHFLVQFPERIHEMHEQIQRARELDPLSRVIGLDLGIALMLLGNLGEATRQLERVVDANPDYALPHYYLGFLNFLNSRADRAIAELRKAVTLSGDEPTYRAELGFVLGSEGYVTEAEQIFASLQETAEGAYVSKVIFARILFGLGRSDEAFGYLEKATEERAHDVLDFNWAPWFRRVRSDPRFQAILKRVNLA